MKKVISAVLALVMAFSMFAINSSAAKEVIYGDLNNDSKINAADALEVLQMATGINDKATGYDLAIGDINADGKTNSNDALLILQRATDLIGEFTKSYDNTTKAKKVDPVFANDAFTFRMTMTEESMGEFDMVFSTDGKAKVIATVIMFAEIVPIEVRMLHLDGANYQVVPTVTIGLEKVPGAYCEIEEDVNYMFDSYVLLFTADTIFGSKTNEKIGGKTYVCETFYSENGASFKYYFLNENLAKLVVSNNGATQTFDITDLEKGADTARLKIPSDCVYDESLLDG